MGYFDFEMIENSQGVPQTAIVSHDGKQTRVSFIQTDVDDEWYAEFKRLGIFKKEGKYVIQNLRDWSYYVPNKTIKITRLP